MDPLCCYTCLQPKAISAFIFIMHIGAYGPRGSRAQYRICKECMLRKDIHRIYGRWWREGPHIQEYSVMTPPVRITILDQIFGRAKRLREQSRLNKRGGDRGVCGKCRREREILFWGCVMCFRRVLDRNRCEDIASRNAIDQIIYGMQSLCVRYIDWWNRHAIIERPFEFRDIVDHGREFVKCLLVGYEQFRYSNWKKRHEIASHGKDHWRAQSKGSESPYDPRGRYWESRCTSCWCRICPRAYHLRDRVDICLIAKLEDTELCLDCHNEMQVAHRLNREV